MNGSRARMYVYRIDREPNFHNACTIGMSYRPSKYGCHIRRVGRCGKPHAFTNAQYTYISFKRIRDDTRVGKEIYMYT